MIERTELDQVSIINEVPAETETIQAHALVESLVVQMGWPSDRVAHYLETLCVPKENVLDFLRLKLKIKP